MNIYCAAVYTNQYMPGMQRYTNLTEHEQYIAEHVPYILESYHYINKQQYVDAMRKNNAKIFLDSGAFSAHTLGTRINLTDYCNYIQENIDILKIEDETLMVSVLDGIGDPLLTYQNQLEMEQLGVKPLPCFHYGEDERYLEWYVANYSYITIGGMVGKSREQLFIWLDRIWNKYLIEGSGNPKLKVHGFGITAIKIMERYPWHSCDSSTWIQSAAFGTIVEPQHGNLSVSAKSPSRHIAGQHISNLTQLEQEHVLKRLEQQGFTYEHLSTVYESRAAYNLWAFGVINTMINAKHTKVFNESVQELF